MYFAGMFRVANVEFVPEYRQEESHEFVSMATKIQHVVSAEETVAGGGRFFPSLMMLSPAGQFRLQDVRCGPTLQAGRHL